MSAITGPRNTFAHRFQSVPPTPGPDTIVSRVFVFSNEEEDPADPDIATVIECGEGMRKGKEDNRVFVMTGGLFYLDWVLAGNFQRVVCIDRSSNTAEFWQHVGNLIVTYPSLPDFILALFRLIIDKEQTFFPLGERELFGEIKEHLIEFDRALKEFLSSKGFPKYLETKQIGAQALLELQILWDHWHVVHPPEHTPIPGGSMVGWLTRQSEYERVRRIFEQRRFVCLTNDWTKPKEINMVAEVLKQEGYRVPIVAISNIAEYTPLASREELVKSLMCMSSPDRNKKHLMIVCHTRSRQQPIPPLIRQMSYAKNREDLLRMVSKDCYLFG